MVKFFKIIEKIVWAIVILEIVAVLAMIFIGASANFDKNQVVIYFTDHLFYRSIIFREILIINITNCIGKSPSAW